MQKKYAVLRVEEWRKRFEETTTNLLRTDGFHSTDGILTDHDEYIRVSTKDEQTFEKKKYYLMTIEELPDMPEPSDGRRYDKLIAERRAQDNGATSVKPARKFRD